MTVYVDDMWKYPMGKFRRMKMSHMIADTEAELHAMADTIGLSRRHYQGDHYDVAMVTRAKAVAAGAKEVTMRELGHIRIAQRKAAATALAEAEATRIVNEERRLEELRNSMEYRSYDDN